MIDRRTFLSIGAGVAAFAVTGAAKAAENELLSAFTARNDNFVFAQENYGGVHPEYRRRLVEYPNQYFAGQIVVDTPARFLYRVRDNRTAIRYGIGVGREGFSFAGIAQVARKSPWPSWHPPAEMREREPDLPEKMEGGPSNPLGARALYLHDEDGNDTLYRIHGTNEPYSIGTAVSSGCIRMLNVDVIDLYRRVPVGTKVVILAHNPAETISSDS